MKSMNLLKFHLPKVLFLFTIVGTLIFFQFERNASMYDRNLYSVFDYVLPMDFKVEKFQGRYSIFDNTGHYPVILAQSEFPSHFIRKRNFNSIYVEEILMISDYNDILRVIAKSSNGELKLITINDYVGDSVIADYEMVSIEKPIPDLSLWYDLEIVPNYIRVWRAYAIAITCFLFILFVMSLITLNLKRNSSNITLD